MEFSKAKDEMFKRTDIKQAPWYDVEADDKRRARLNCIAHILSMVPYEDATPPPLKLPPRRPPVLPRHPAPHRRFRLVACDCPRPSSTRTRTAR